MKDYLKTNIINLPDNVMDGINEIIDETIEVNRSAVNPKPTSMRLKSWENHSSNKVGVLLS